MELHWGRLPYGVFTTTYSIRKLRPFASPRLGAAIADRITVRCTLIQTGTESYRYQSTEADRQAMPAR
ncbi:hypothetical protein ABZY19_29115 [Streptomyces sp. NPDC006475]|uniref:hypothetical protein n=1 Tax=Streptomyces sp. NPDC006475 TaxID=3155719 RepID=UPI0033A99AFC